MSPTRWRPRTLLDSPHRLCFFGAGVQWLASALWWAATLVWGGDMAGVPSVALHALWFSLGAMPLFIVGFVLTAGPKWVQAPAVEASGLRVGVVVFSLGWLLTALGAALDGRVAAAGLLAAASGLGLLTWRAVLMVRGSTRADTLHPRLIVGALGLMSLGLVGAAWAVWAAQGGMLVAMARAALWWGPVSVFIVASHRMLPFLGDGLWPALERRWPRWPLWLLVSVAASQGAWAFSPGTGGEIGRGLNSAHLLLACAGSAALTLRWLGAPALKSALVRMLYGASLWWLIALLMLAAAAWPGLAPDAARRLHMAGLHALTVGYLGGTLLAMATRVSATHQGRSQAIDGQGRLLFAVLQAATALRVAAAWWPAYSGLMLPAAGVAWLLVALVWTARHGRWLGQQPAARGPKASGVARA
ncbi:NnrS family protein [Ideonella sp.]|uniref:NnrS family protein n=1 Tax=Ideonella sp. TaxID=1929293 RepID=UPI0035B412D9